ncbi:MAG: hypothetical protein IT366_14335 [Candidatus Hydrogenedentes bacterium]|nr:hypothetical protein [Candidatus Hydrogenedentota bacterium]
MRSIGISILAVTLASIAGAQQEIQFENPPANDRPWVYWFWKNGNISREGITADLEAMQRVGVGGAILMEVALSVPPGQYKFFTPEWRDMFKFAIQEAKRTGIEISVNSAPGWTGSGGPWVTPEQSMQQVVFSETNVAGPNAIAMALPAPDAVLGYYSDIAVLALPVTTGTYRIADIAEKAFYKRGAFSSQPSVRAALPSLADYEDVPQDAVVPLQRIVDLTSHMDKDGKLTWDAPDGNWTILRIGHTSTGQTNRPAPLPGLECDKLDTEALDAHYRAFINVLLEDLGPDLRKALVSVHLDSWEVGAQNWSRNFRREFVKRREYDPLPYLPVMSGRVVESLEVSERFLWDLRQTVSELIVENHGRRLRELAHNEGLWFSVEPYDMTPCDDMSLGATADVPMCEFWSKGFDTRYSVHEATSVAHVYDKPVVAAEAFTSIDRWLFHPGTIKAQGDWAFCEGVNRFVIHRYIHQPYPNIRPGLSLGPHGLHYERTQTWWEFSRPWHEYLARCQHVLRQGRFVSDVLYLGREGAPNVFQAPDPAPRGYKYDGCTPEALLTRVKADQGQLVLPNGAGYRMLVLPNTETMTPALLWKVAEFAASGVLLVGAPPRKSPSLSKYPECDAEVAQLTAQIWGASGGTVVIPQDSPKAAESIGNAREALAHAHWIWHSETDPSTAPPPGKRYFRRVFSLPEKAQVRRARVVMTADNTFELYINGSVAGNGDNLNELYTSDVTSFIRTGENIVAVAAENKGGKPNAAGLVGVLKIDLEGQVEITVPVDSQWLSSSEVEASWTQSKDPRGWSQAHDIGLFGIAPWEDVGKKADRIDPYPDSAQIESLLHTMGVLPDFYTEAPLGYAHRQLGTDDVYFVRNESQDAVSATCTFRVENKDAELWHPETGRRRGLNRVSQTVDRRTTLPLRFEPIESYFIVFSPRVGVDAPEMANADFPNYRIVETIDGAWSVTFDPANGGSGEAVTFDELEDWSLHAEERIRFYSGTAVYAKTIEIPEVVFKERQPLHIDLGRVEAMASVSLNGKDLGIVWKRPFRIAVRDTARPGKNDLLLRVVNLWPNRMIADEHLPPDSERDESGNLKRWPQWMLENGKSPTGRVTFATWRHWTADSPLIPSGLLGPVTILLEE